MKNSGNCIRCTTALPNGTSFCTACGHTNETDIAKRGLKIHKGLTKRAAKRALWRRLTTFIWIFGR